MSLEDLSLTKSSTQQHDDAFERIPELTLQVKMQLLYPWYISYHFTFKCLFQVQANVYCGRAPLPGAASARATSNANGRAHESEEI